MADSLNVNRFRLKQIFPELNTQFKSLSEFGSSKTNKITYKMRQKIIILDTLNIHTQKVLDASQFDLALNVSCL